MWRVLFGPFSPFEFSIQQRHTLLICQELSQKERCWLAGGEERSWIEFKSFADSSPSHSKDHHSGSDSSWVGEKKRKNPLRALPPDVPSTERGWNGSNFCPFPGQRSSGKCSKSEQCTGKVALNAQVFVGNGNEEARKNSTEVQREELWRFRSSCLV